MSTQFYCVFGSEDAARIGIDPKGWIEIHATDIQDAREIAEKLFPASRALPFGGWGEIYTSTKLPILGVATRTHRTWKFIGKEIV